MSFFKHLIRYAFSLLLVGLVTIIGSPIHKYVESTNIVMLYLAVVVVSALFWGRGPAMVASAVSVLAFDFFLVSPRLSFSVNDTQYLITFAGFFAVGLIISNLAASVQAQVKELKEREVVNSSLYALSRSLTEANGTQGVLESIKEQVQNTFHASAEIQLQETFFPNNAADEKLQKSTQSPSLFFIDNTTYIPMTASSGIVGMLGVNKISLSSKETDLLRSFALLSAMAIERVNLEDQAKQASLLQEVEKLQSALLDTVSHDLRTPLVSISGALDTLASSELKNSKLKLTPEMRRSMIENAREEANYLNRLVGDLLDLSRLESGSIHLSCDFYDINEVLGAGFVKVRRTQGNHKFLTEIEPDLPMIWLDIVLMERVLTNLLDNSIKYSPDGAPIQISARKEGSEIEITISNLGPKIADKDLDHIFEKFNLIRTSKSIGGTGLGLSICRRIIEIHNGRIWAKNNEGSGCSFIFTLPIINSEVVMKHE